MKLTVTLRRLHMAAHIDDLAVIAVVGKLLYPIGGNALNDIDGFLMSVGV